MSDEKRILVLSAGGTEDPLIFAIDEINPDFVYFLYTPRSKKTCEKVIEKTHQKYHYNFINNTNDELVLDFYSQDYDFVEENQNIAIRKKYIDYKPVLSDEYMINNHQSLDEAFEVSKKLLSNINDKIEKSYESDEGKEVKVYVDFTGGTKTMVSGLVLAVIEGEFNDFELTYVGEKTIEDNKTATGRDKGGVGVVKKGYELYEKQINPYNKHAIPEFNKGINFFNKYQFEAAQENFDSAKKNLDEGFDKKLAELYSELVFIYNKWDKFDEEKITKNTSAFDMLKKLFYKKIDADVELKRHLKNTELNIAQKNIGRDMDKRQSNLYDSLQNNLEFLSLKIRGLSPDVPTKKKEPLEKRIEYYLPDLLNNAYRRIEEGKIDDAIARLYRISELIAQIKLCELGLINLNTLESNKKFKIPIKTLEDKASEKGICDEVSSFIEDNKEKPYVFTDEDGNLIEKESKNLKIANVNSYKLLKMFGFDRVKEFEELYEDLKNRNDTILAHGLKPMDKDDTVEIYYKTKEFASLFYEDLDYHMELSQFPKLVKGEFYEN